ncbi:MAG TPA: hypothetical protein DDX40_06020 [Rikenellaceae bacterium]|nr:hypothetical protein [Rikenellaceae bacterium]
MANIAKIILPKLFWQNNFNKIKVLISSHGRKRHFSQPTFIRFDTGFSADYTILFNIILFHINLYDKNHSIRIILPKFRRLVTCKKSKALIKKPLPGLGNVRDFT